MNYSSGNILIRDPYLNSATKTDNISIKNDYSINRPHQTYDISNHEKWLKKSDQPKENNYLKRELENTKNQYKKITHAFADENQLNHKILNYQAVNNQYHQALKLRNLDLNNKLVGLATDNKLLSQQLEAEYLRNYQNKDDIFKKFQTQAEQVLHLKKTINQLLTLKTRMEEQIIQLRFGLETQSERFNLEIRQHVIRLQGMQRAMKNLGQTKDQEIIQLRNRIRIYEDQNKRLNDENRTLHLTNKDYDNKKAIQNLSQIHHLDSQTKENLDQNIQGPVQRQLLEQKNMNQKLQKQINQLKRKLFDDDDRLNTNKKGEKRNLTNDEANLYNKQDQKRALQKKDARKSFDPSQCDGYVGSITTLRNGINKEVFQIFFKSVRDGQKHRSNSLVIFIENWKILDIDRLQPYIDSYFEARNSLKEMYKKQGLTSKTPTGLKIEQCIPLYIGSRKGRNQINQWILSTIQFTKNQRQVSKKSLNNLLLFLFRLLTIQYRITYPMQGKSYTIDADVKNQLHHEIVKAIDYIRNYK